MIALVIYTAIVLAVGVRIGRYLERREHRRNDRIRVAAQRLGAGR